MENIRNVGIIHPAFYVTVMNVSLCAVSLYKEFFYASILTIEGNLYKENCVQY